MFFSLKSSTDDSVGNVFPQVSCLNPELTRSIRVNTFVYFDTELIFQLQPQAILTDILSQGNISANGLLISDKLKDIFTEYNIIEHRFYKCIVFDSFGRSHNYYWLHLFDVSLFDKINYQGSLFYALEYGFRENDVKLSSFADYERLLKQLGVMWGIKSEYLKLNSSFDLTLDLFRVPLIGNNIIISSRLAERIKSENVTGASIQPTEEIRN